MNYEELIKNLMKIKDEEERINSLFNFLLNHFEYDYIILWLSKLALCAKNNNIEFVDLYDQEMFTETIKQFKKYLDIPMFVVEYFQERKFENLKPGKVSDSPMFENGILKKGVCIDFSQFIKQVCDDIGIECEKQFGTTPYKHAWNKIFLDNQWLNYDMTYAIYSRDKYDGWDLKTKSEDWFGISDEQLLRLHPERKINDDNVKL